MIDDSIHPYPYIEDEFVITRGHVIVKKLKRRNVVPYVHIYFNYSVSIEIHLNHSHVKSLNPEKLVHHSFRDIELFT